jgi:thiol-disulfide isomerase/thioredoxin
MDRLRPLSSACLLGALAIAGCGDDTGVTSEAPPSRVEAVAARQEDPAERFCDVSAPVGEGRALELPPLEGAPAPASGWRWINVWATWCEPCVEEMPRIVAWRERLAADGAPIEPFFLSVDRTEGEVSAFHTLHPDAPTGSRILDPDGLEALVASLGLDPGATIPIHALVDPQHRIRCVRTGSVAERDYETVRAIIRGR